MGHASLASLRTLWWRRVGTAGRRALGSTLLLAVVGGAWIARRGTWDMRILALAPTLLVLGAWVVGWRQYLAHMHNPSRLIRDLVMPLRQEVGGKLLRAERLLQRAQSTPGGVSLELAWLHFDRFASLLPLGDVTRRARRRALLLGILAATALGAAAVMILFDPQRALEGANVLLARNHKAPFGVEWLDLEPANVRPPRTAQEDDYPEIAEMGSRLPVAQGSLLKLRGVPRHPGRNLILSDGQLEVPFVDDGQGGVEVTYRVRKDVHLRLAARFGDVLVFQPGTLDVRAIMDQVPHVILQGAPRTLTLRELDEIPVHFQATDDHGLFQVDLVMECGSRQERRTLLRLDGKTRSETGAYLLEVRDPFLVDCYLPTTLRVQARDEDGLAGPRWGASAALTLLPASIGEPEATRLARLHEARRLLVDWLALELSQSRRPSALERATAAHRAEDGLTTACNGVSMGLGLTEALSAFLRAQREKIERLSRSPNPDRRVLESILLAVDVTVESLASRDAKVVSRRLAEIAEDIAAVAHKAQRSESREMQMARFDGLLSALDGGHRQLLRLGTLGEDLGGIAGAGLGRMRTALSGRDLLHTEWAAAFLAQRLRRPEPSFAGQGQAGVESGGMAHPSLSRPSSDAQERFDRLSLELQQIVVEHARGIETVEGVLSGARGSNREAVEHGQEPSRARKIRQDIDFLPRLGGEPGSTQAVAALIREHALGAAESLDRGATTAAQRGLEGALSALDEAMVRDGTDQETEPRVSRDRLEQLKGELLEQLHWLRRQNQHQEQAMDREVAPALRGVSGTERELAERTNAIGQREQRPDSVLPEDVQNGILRASRLMREASVSLDSAQGEDALRLQRRAQRLLEQADLGQTDSEPDRSVEHGSANKASTPSPADPSSSIAPTDDASRRDRFRQRVQRGLSRSSGHGLDGPVRRYAEGLLR